MRVQRVALALAALGCLWWASAPVRSTRGVPPGHSRRSLIKGGAPVGSSSEYPFVCSLRSGSTGKHLCGATLIAPDLAVTAAFCVASPKGTPDPVLYCGLTHLYRDPPGSFDVLKTVKTTLHPDYEPGTYCNDIALLELNASARGARPIGHILQPGQFSFTEGHPFIALGWGNTGVNDPAINATNPFPDTLQRVELPLISHEECDVASVFDGRVFSPMMLCAGYWEGEADACAGDSGGPLIDTTENGADSTLIGIVSWGVGCARPGYPGVYTRLDTFAPWVEDSGFCGCTSTGLSGTVQTGAPGCASGAAARAEGVGPGQSICYILDPERCTSATPSKAHSGAAWVACGASAPPVAEPALDPRVRAYGFRFYPPNCTCACVVTDGRP